MDVEQIRGLRPMLSRFVKRFDDCFARKDTRAHLAVYIYGQLSDLPRKSVEPIALAADVPVRTLQEFLSQHRWQEDLARDRLQQIVAEEHSHPHSVGVIDETSFVKKGNKTPGVQRQHLGALPNDRCVAVAAAAARRRELSRAAGLRRTSSVSFGGIRR